MCYAVISYAMVYAPQLREMASEQPRDGSRRGGTTEQRTDAEASDGETKEVTIRVTGATGESFGANYGTLRSSNTVEGVVPADYEVEVNTDPSAGDYVTATAWKTVGNRKELKVQLLDNGRVVQETSTTKDYGATGIRWNPNEQPAPENTMPGAEKTKEDTKLRYKTKEDTKFR